MNISGPFVRRPIATALLAIAVFLAGMVSFRSLPGGEYTVRVIVRGSRGEVLASSSAMSRVVERGVEQ